MHEVLKLRLQIIVLCYVFNPGAVVIGLCAYSYVMPDDAFPSILASRPQLYAWFLVGLLLMAASFWRVFVLANKVKLIKNAKI